ncbi:GIY-YIG nuclease family protein [bacterium]|nr:GIY-YIG nuclease family protein [bacterium]
MWYTYILKCSDLTYYTGITNNLKKRIEDHNKGTASKYTRARLPVKLAYSERKKSRSTASKREHEIKNLSRENKQILIKSKS